MQLNERLKPVGGGGNREGGQTGGRGGVSAREEDLFFHISVALKLLYKCNSNMSSYVFFI